MPEPSGAGPIRESAYADDDVETFGAPAEERERPFTETCTLASTRGKAA